MYSYINVKGFYENKIKDGDWGFGNKQYWNLDHEYIQLLTTFLTQ